MKTNSEERLELMLSTARGQKGSIKVNPVVACSVIRTEISSYRHPLQRLNV